MAAPAAQVRFQGDAVACLHAPGGGGIGTQFLDDADRLVPRDQRVLHQALGGEGAAILLDVAAAQPAGLHPEERVLRAEPRNLDLATLDPTVVDLDHDLRFHAPSPIRSIVLMTLVRPSRASSNACWPSSSA